MLTPHLSILLCFESKCSVLPHWVAFQIAIAGFVFSFFFFYKFWVFWSPPDVWFTSGSGVGFDFFFFFVFFIDFDWLLLSFLKVNSWGVCLGLIWLIWGNENVLFVSTLKCDVWCLFSDDCVMCSVWGFWRVAPENGWHSRSGWGCRGKV